MGTAFLIWQGPSVIDGETRRCWKKVAMSCRAMPCHAMLCHAMPCHAMPCHAMLCYAMLCMLCCATKVFSAPRSDGRVGMASPGPIVQKGPRSPSPEPSADPRLAHEMAHHAALVRAPTALLPHTGMGVLLRTFPIRQVRTQTELLPHMDCMASSRAPSSYGRGVLLSTFFIWAWRPPEHLPHMVMASS